MEVFQRELRCFVRVGTGRSDYIYVIARTKSITNPRVTDDGRFSEDEIFQVQANATRSMNWKLPTWFKVGAKATEDYYRFRNPNAAYVWRYDGPGGGPAGSFSEFAYPQYPFDMDRDVAIRSLSGRGPTYPNRSKLGDLFLHQPELFTNVATPANFYTAYIANSRNVKERFLAGFWCLPTRRRRVQGAV